VLTAEELGAMLVAAEIDVDACDPAEAAATGSHAGHRFAVSGGVAAAVSACLPPAAAPKTVAVNGLTPKTIRLLASFARAGKAPGALVEVMACEGGCAAGPCSFEDPARAAARLAEAHPAPQSQAPRPTAPGA
jgi:iron only hydrogenase large subunit-like protein